MVPSPVQSANNGARNASSLAGSDIFCGHLHDFPVLHLYLVGMGIQDIAKGLVRFVLPEASCHPHSNLLAGRYLP